MVQAAGIMEHPVLRPSLADPSDSATGQKRKRASGLASPDARRSKRSSAVPAPSIATPATAVEPPSFPVDNAVNIARAAHAQSAHSTQELDFSALEQATADQPDQPEPAALPSTTPTPAVSVYPPPQPSPSTVEPFPGAGLPQPLSHTMSSFDMPPGPAGATITPVLPALPAPLTSANGLPRDGLRQQVPNSRPPVGSDEWHKQRKDNHKEVERRRREAINEGINELAKLVPNCEKNKGQILQQTVQYIHQLQAKNGSNGDQRTLEKLLMEQAVSELSSKNDSLQLQLKELLEELEAWKQLARAHGLEPPSQDKAEPSTGSEGDS